MQEHVATCPCEQLRVTCAGDPIRVSVCHCHECQRRSGSAFAVQARWPDERVTMTGACREWSRRGDSGTLATFRFCGHCGGTVAFVIDTMPGVTAVPVGTLADPAFQPPAFSVFEARKHVWLTVTGDGIEHFD